MQARDRVGVFRILDASANRCREGLRVVEDFVRFRLDDALVSQELKQIRHLLTSTLVALGQSDWAACRDTLNDVGTLETLPSEQQRGSLTDVVRANLKRVEEALRSLEEFSKLLDPALSQKISACRYRMYTVEKSVETIIRSQQRLQNCRLYLLVTASQCSGGVEKVVRESLEGGVDIVQIREKGMSDRNLLDDAKQMRKWTAAAGALLIINDRPDIAAAVGADGVHLGQDDLDVATARQILGKSGLIGVSTHHLEQAEKALFDGADYLGVGPVFPSVTKEFTEFSGLHYVTQIAEATQLPWFAIGGITVDNVTHVQTARATRVAVSSALCSATDPKGVAMNFVKQLQAATPSDSVPMS